jgi:transcriptional regulator with XRE-family HTH domain
VGEALRGIPEDPAVAGARDAATPRSSIGAYLSRQRTLRGISLDELEAATRIPRRSLERLESGVYDRDRDAFARSFVRTVASALGLDAEDAVARLLAEALPHARSPGARRLRARRVAAVAAAALLVLLPLVLWLAGVLTLPMLTPAGEAERPLVHRRDALRPLLPQARQRQLLAPPETPVEPTAEVSPPAVSAPTPATP